MFYVFNILVSRNNTIIDPGDVPQCFANSDTIMILSPFKVFQLAHKKNYFRGEPLSEEMNLVYLPDKRALCYTLRDSSGKRVKGSLWRYRLVYFNAKDGTLVKKSFADRFIDRFWHGDF
jgi:hypothetical protein